MAFISVRVDGNDPKNINCRQKLDDGEFIDVLLFPLTNLFKSLCNFVKDNESKNIIIDSRLYTLAQGIDIGMTIQNKLQNVCQD